MMLAEAGSPLSHILDHAWSIGGRSVPWLSSQIAVLILAGLLLAAVPALARRRGRIGYVFVEAFVSFVRNQIARPALRDKADAFVPFLATLLAFLLVVNLLGLVPLLNISELLGLHETPVGGTPTGSIYVCGALAAMTFGMIIFGGYVGSVHQLWRGPAPDHHGGHGPDPGANLVLRMAQAIQRRRWPLPLAAVAAVPVWMSNFVPPVPGVAGLVLWPVLLALELIGHAARCFALCIRLFANMTAGHLLLAVLLLMAGAAQGWAISYVSVPSALGSVALMLLELAVAAIQAYLFTILSAVFIGLTVNPQH